MHLGGEALQGILQGDEFVAVFFQEFAARVEGKTAISGRQQCEEELGALAQILDCACE